jgi:peroxiredoxin
MKKNLILSAAVLALTASAVPANAELAKGAKAPAIATQGALAGKQFSFNLRNALKNGPVVLYFFPAAFTPGCTLEANAFAEAMDDFESAGAQVVGMSADGIDKLKDFSTKECRDKFAVASASAATVKAYDVNLVMNGQDSGLTKRTSYVIDTDGTITMAYSEMDWREHVSRSLAEVRRLQKGG